MIRKKHPPAGARPGTLTIHDTALAPKLRLMRWTEATLEERDVERVDELDDVLVPGTLTWLDVQGLGDETLLRTLAERFKIHPLALEDLVNVPSRPKAESYEEHLLIITRMIQVRDHTPYAATISIEQVGIVIGKDFVLTFQEAYGDVLDPVRVRIRANGLLRRSGSDYLAYALFDAIVDAYYPAVETLGDVLEQLEDLVMTRPEARTLQRLNRVKGSLLAVRRAVAPQREAVNRLIRDESPFITDMVRPYLRDVYDHCIQTNEAIEAAREMASGLMNTYLSVVSNRTNDVMKVLTIVASIFVPLTFMAGIYGMNFEYIPELRLRWGYPALLAAMAVTAVGMLFYFYRKGWIGAGPDRS